MKARIRTTLGNEPLLSVPLVALLTGLGAALLAMVLYKLGNPQHQLKAGLGAVALVVVVIAALRPVFALGLVLALLPFEFHVFGVGTDEALIFGVGAVLAWRIQGRRIPSWIVFGGLALVLGSLFSVLTAHDRGSAAWGALRWFGVFLLMAEAFSILHDDPQAGRRMARIITSSAVVVVFFGILQKQGIYVLVGAPFQAGQVQVLFLYYTYYGGFVALAAVVATGEMLASSLTHDRSRLLLYAAATIFLLVGTAISASRGALLALGTGWVLLLVLSSRRPSVLFRLVALLVVLGAAAYAATPSATRAHYIARFSGPIGSQTEDQQRLTLQHLGEQALAHHPLGIGFNNFKYYAGSHPANTLNQVFDHSHELLIQTGLDAGWLGLAGLVILVSGAFVVAMRAGPKHGIRHIVCAACVGGFIAQGLVDYFLFDISLVAFLLALIWGSAQTPRSALDTR